MADDPRLRDSAELAKLPPEERRACRSLWRDLDALLKDLPPTKQVTDLGRSGEQADGLAPE